MQRVGFSRGYASNGSCMHVCAASVVWLSGKALGLEHVSVLDEVCECGAPGGRG